ncbi:glycosyltransferase 87 family protein [Streptacidiphilus sp. ASG 303]|uniref:glycosyltransferase 87 family protein n=1 Tax=Streptacidiphilus sp. ASG 303 TaxID=2896847 RepID=UPI001E375837|nr:glycosyltransferase 87 family protein [Streptacidiphilus sp. ASG 303]MCD0483956.1 glycosyltransferase 87 family protein [Streptacidiphilus sp. ASG 303]
MVTTRLPGRLHAAALRRPGTGRTPHPAPLEALAALTAARTAPPRRMPGPWLPGPAPVVPSPRAAGGGLPGPARPAPRTVPAPAAARALPAALRALAAVRALPLPRTPAVRAASPAVRSALAACTRAAGSRRARVLACLAAAAWAAAFPLTSRLANQRTWGLLAAAAYLAAALAVGLLPRARGARTAARTAFAGAVVLPLAVLALQGHRQSEVGVVERSAQLLLHTGSPYLADPAVVTDYNPYLPAMALFGLPRALLGGGDATTDVTAGDGGLTGLLGDARLWFAAAFLLCAAAAWRLLRPHGTPAVPAGAPRPASPLLVLTASPLVALPLAVGGVDLPLTGFCVLALALAARGRAAAAGLALALACALKWTAWPALPVAAVLLLAAHGRRAALRCAAIAVAGAAATVLPTALTHPGAMLEQVVRFPLGLTAVRTPAASPLPGRLIAAYAPGGSATCLVLLCLGGGAVAARLLLRPPLTAVQAADQLAVGLATAFLLAPAGRFGYLALPALIALWPRLAARAARRAAVDLAVPERPVPDRAVPGRAAAEDAAAVVPVPRPPLDLRAPAAP